MTVLREGVVGGALNVFFIYKFLRILTQPFNETDAFKLGIIDENGKILKKHKKLKTQEEKDSYTLMHRLVWKLKRLMEKIPFGKSRLASYAAALWLIKESHKFNGTDEELQESFLSFLETDWENDARILKENYEGDMDKKTYKNLKEGIDIKKADMKDVIKDFQSSDAPQFKGKSDKKKKEMAIAAKLSKEEIETEASAYRDASQKDSKKKGYKKKYGRMPFQFTTHKRDRRGVKVEEVELDEESVKDIDKLQREIEKALDKNDIKKVKELMHKKDALMDKLYKREEVELDEEFSEKDFDKLKKGDIISLTFKSSMSTGTSKFKVTAKNIVGKAKVHKATLQNVKNPKSVKFFLYKRGNKVSLAQGDMAASVVKYTVEEVELDEAKKKDVGMECQECGKKFRAKLSSLEYGKTKCPKCKSTDIDFQFGENVDEKHGGFHWKKGMKIKPKKVKKMKDLRLYAKSPSKNKSSSSAPHVPAYGISRKGGWGAGKGYGAPGRAPIMMGEEEINEKEAAYPPTVDNLKKIVKDKQNQIFMFKDGKARVDLFSASALMGVYNALKPATKKKFETMIKTKGGFMKSVDFAMKMAKEEVDPHAKVMAKRGDSPEKIKDMHPEITDDELEKLFKEEFNVTTVTAFKSFLSEGRPALDPDFVPARTQTDTMRAKLLSTQKKLYSSKDIESIARKYKQKLVGDPVGGKSWGGDWEIVLRNGISLSYEYGPNMTNIKGWKFDRKAIKNYINKYANEHETPRDYAPMGGKVLVGGLEAAFEVISEEVELEEGWKKGKYTIKDKNGKILGTYNSGGKAQKAMDDLMQKGDYDKLEVSLVEEAPANSVAGGNIEFGPFVKKKRKNAKVQTEMFGGQKVFVVSPERFFDSRLGKSRYARYEKYVGNDKLGEAIRQYGRNNPKNSIILKNSGNGAMLYLKYGNKK